VRPLRGLANSSLSRALSFLLQKDQTHQPRRHRPGIAAGFAAHHHAALVVKTNADDRYGRVVFFVRATDQVGVGIFSRRSLPYPKRQSDLFCAHKTSAAVTLLLVLNLIMHATLSNQGFRAHYQCRVLRPGEHQEKSMLIFSLSRVARVVLRWLMRSVPGADRGPSWHWIAR